MDTSQAVHPVQQALNLLQSIQQAVRIIGHHNDNVSHEATKVALESARKLTAPEPPEYATLHHNFGVRECLRKDVPIMSSLQLVNRKRHLKCV